MNTPSKEALDAARDLFKQRNCFASDNDNAAIIDRHFEPLRAEMVQLTVDRDNWKIRAEEMDEYKADCMELRQRAKQAVARVKEVETDLSSLRVAYEQNASQCVQLNRELAMKPDTVEWLNGVTIQRQRAEQAEAHIADLVAALDDLLGCPTVTDLATCPNGDPSRIDEAPEWQAVLQISCAWTRYKKLKVLARAESATPAKQEVKS